MGAYWHGIPSRRDSPGVDPWGSSFMGNPQFGFWVNESIKPGINPHALMDVQLKKVHCRLRSTDCIRLYENLNNNKVFFSFRTLKSSKKTP